jgi:biotin carboxyl carrier protein
VNGTVVELFAKLGQPVKPGDKLARIEVDEE